MTVRLTLEIKLMDDKLDEEEKLYYENEILIANTLEIHSNEIGDSLGTIKKVSNIQWKEEQKP